MNPTETGLYSLLSRYYDPTTGRFINADGAINANQNILGNNLFTYCSNNPVNFSDPTGEAEKWILNGIVYNYDGSVCDFRRSERGLSPRAYEEVLEEYNNMSFAAKIEKKPNMTPRKDKKKGSDNRNKSGDRERNVAHPNGEEHSRVAKGTNNNRYTALGALAVTSIVIIIVVADDATGVGVSDDGLLASASVIWWDMASKAFG